MVTPSFAGRYSSIKKVDFPNLKPLKNGGYKERRGRRSLLRGTGQNPLPQQSIGSDAEKFLGGTGKLGNGSLP
jgi:hypothetical protein